MSQTNEKLILQCTSLKTALRETRDPAGPDDHWGLQEEAAGAACKAVEPVEAVESPGQEQMIKYPSGAVRNPATGKPRPDLISPFAEERLGKLLAEGAAVYGENNWTYGLPDSRCFAATRRHLMAFQQGNRDEDHLAAAMFNVMVLLHNDELRSRGVIQHDCVDDMILWDVL